MINVYGLVDSKDNKVYYVGVSKHHILFRLGYHVSAACYNLTHRVRGNKSRVAQWINKLIIEDGKLPIIILLEEVQEYEAMKSEKTWVRYYEKLNPGLLNIKHNNPNLKGLYKTRITQEIKAEVREKYLTGNYNRQKLADEYKISVSSLRTICL